ncbi:hypothetical protein F5B22DRAFT_231457 [Xylaria bambusicola]|uniref:uncharacterized protein n=1 Tax=Xylaria bambusicola TaxID=326684 RepID=UPI002007EF54|nr:uncharacterized protein F5B22DRAFT_231457 [Xylaria bambusicola]KAI0514539.1 hypothetical protein F5B22DRAFT_231457 [Xylaria bambusicola]
MLSAEFRRAVYILLVQRALAGLTLSIVTQFKGSYPGGYDWEKRMGYASLMLSIWGWREEGVGRWVLCSTRTMLGVWLGEWNGSVGFGKRVTGRFV